MNKLFLRGIFPHTKRMHTLGSLTKLYQKSGVQFAVRKTRAIRILPEHLSDMEAIMPPIGKPVLKTYPDQLPAKGTAKQSAAMFTGCIMDVMFSDVNEATVRVLQKNGHDVHIPKNQKCCGALHVHAGDRAMGKKLARENIDAFMNEDHIVVNAAGCGCALKEYPELLQNDEEYREKAEAFSERVIDVSKYLYDYGYEPPKAEINKRITYHDACHLAHGQQVWDEPRELLEQIPGVEMVHLPDADRCCGSAGIYNLTNPDMAGRLLKRKIDDVPENVEMISMGNPGCMLQIALGVKKYGRSENVVHTMQLLDWAYEKEEST